MEASQEDAKAKIAGNNEKMEANQEKMEIKMDTAITAIQERMVPQ
jgi:hypothetical protein